MSIITNHTRAIGGNPNEWNVFTLVLQKLRFLADDSAAMPPANANANAISIVTYEVMLFLNPCFRLEAADVGNEANYTVEMLSIIADVTAYNILLYRSIALGGNSQGYTLVTPPTTATTGTFIKKHQSDNTSVEWGQLNMAQGGSHGDLKTQDLLSMLFSAACSKLHQFGCELCQCADKSLELNPLQGIVQPFIILGHC
jgi:hypothetical protein